MLKSATAAQLCAEAAKHGVTDLEIGPAGRGYEVAAYTPEGKVWVATDAHTMVHHWQTDPAGCRAAALTEMRMGVRDCDDPDCQVGCHAPKPQKDAYQQLIDDLSAPGGIRW